jgi:pimeloyl-ACP methyl ester carboxylesterase
MLERGIAGELITVTSAKGLGLDGICYREAGNKTTVIHIHGSFGNFYQNEFVRVMAARYGNARVNLISVNMASHDGLAEGYRYRDEFEYLGGAVADFNECVADIEGAVRYAMGFSDRIILQGHSLGCDRVLQFLISSGKLYDFILLSPCDSYQLQAKWIAPETVEAQIARIKAQSREELSLDWLSSREYGVLGGNGWTYPIPITRNAFLSIAQGPPFRLMNVEQPAHFSLVGKALIYIGGQDSLQVWPPNVMFQYLKERISETRDIYMPGGDHMLGGCELEVIEEIIGWF